MSQIALKAVTTLWSTYAGRGIPSRPLTLEAGTLVDYKKTDMNPLCHFLPYIVTVHTVSVVEKYGQRFEANRRTMVLRKPFDASTYYKAAIRPCGRGNWMCGGDGVVYADDGFGNLVEAAWADVVNFYGTVKTVEDCVVGLHYWIPKLNPTTEQ
jgi:hypothetical protein